MTGPSNWFWLGRVLRNINAISYASANYQTQPYLRSSSAPIPVFPLFLFAVYAKSTFRRMFPWVLLNAVPGSLLISSIPGAFTSFEMISNNIRPQFPRSSQVRLGLDPTKICLDGWRQETTLRHRPFLESSLHPTNPIFFPKVAQSQTPVPFVRPPVVSHSARRLRWAHRGVGLCRGHRDGLLWSFDPVPDGNRFLSRFFEQLNPL